MSTLASIPPIHMPKTEPNTEVKIEPESWHVLRHWAKVKIQTTGELMIVQVSYLPEEGARHSAWTEDPASPPPLQASRGSRPTPRAPIIPAPVYLNASPQMVVGSPEPFAYDDQDPDDNGLETNATPSLIPDQDEDLIVNDVFICVGCTHHFDMSSCLDVDQPEHISPSSRREGEESGWFCYGCLAEAYRDLRDEMDALRAILEDEQKAAREEAVEAGDLVDGAPAEENQVEEGVLVDLDPAFDEDTQQQEDVQTPTDSENTLIASELDLIEEPETWVTLQDTFSTELEQIAGWMPETGMESPNKDVKPVEEQLSMFRLQLTILMSGKSDEYVTVSRPSLILTSNYISQRFVVVAIRQDLQKARVSLRATHRAPRRSSSTLASYPPSLSGPSRRYDVPRDSLLGEGTWSSRDSLDHYQRSTRDRACPANPRSNSRYAHGPRAEQDLAQAPARSRSPVDLVQYRQDLRTQTILGYENHRRCRPVDLGRRTKCLKSSAGKGRRGNGNSEDFTKRNGYHLDHRGYEAI